MTATHKHMHEQLAGLEGRLHGLTPEEAGKRLRYGTLVGGNATYIFMETPKAACSTMKWLLTHIEGRHPVPRAIGIESSLAMSIHSPLVHGFPGLMNVDAENPESLLCNDAVVRFCVVRNPYSRVVSAWADKVRQREPRYNEVWREIAAHCGLPDGECPSFRQFALWLTQTQDVRRCNHHWRGMTWLLLPDLMHYTHVLRTETLAEDLAGVLAVIAPGNDARSLLEKFSVNESLPLYNRHALFDEEIASLVYDFYREDFERYGYHRDSWRTSPPGDAAQESVWLREFAGTLEQRALAIIRARNDLIDDLARTLDTLRPLRQFAAGKGEPADFLRDLGANLLQSGEAERARDLLAAAVTLRPHGAFIRLLLARSLIDCGQQEEARPHLEIAMKNPACQAEASALLLQISQRLNRNDCR